MEDNKSTYKENGTQEEKIDKVIDNIKSPDVFKKRKGIFATVFIILIIAIIAFASTGKLRTYYKAKNLIEDKKYEEAKKVIQGIDDYKNYKDSENLEYECNYQMAKQYIDEEKYTDALYFLNVLIKNNYKDSKDLESFCKYEMAKQKYDNGQYEYAIEDLKKLSEKNYKDSLDLYKKTAYALGKKYIDENAYEDGIQLLKGLDYEDSEEIVNSIENGEMSLNKFVERYNYVVDSLNASENLELGKISAEDLKENKLTTGLGV